MKKHILYIIAILAQCFLGSATLHADNFLTAELTETKAGKSWNMDILLHGTESNFTAFQLDIMLPQGVKLSEEGIATTPCTADHTIQSSIQADGQLRIVGYSASNSAIIGSGSRAIASLQIEASEIMEQGQYEVSLSNIRFALRNGTEIAMDNYTAALTSSWQELYKLTYWVEGEEYFSQALAAGDSIDAPEAPSKEGHTFIEWEGLPNTMPEGDAEVHAVFEVNSNVISFYQDGEVYATQEVNYGEAIVAPEVESTDELLFNGWQDVPETMPARDISIYGSTTVTGIDSAVAKEKKVQNVYDVSGRKVRSYNGKISGLQRGVYIVGGQKNFVR